MDKDFLLTDCTPFLPHSDSGMILDELLTKFCCEQGTTFFSATKLMNQFGILSLVDGVQSTVQHLNILQAAGTSNALRTANWATFKNCPLV